MRALALAVLIGCGGASSPATAPEPVLDCTPAAGTSMLRGIVVDARTHAPTHSSVMVKSACSPRPARYALIDDQGAYFFADLPADTYDVFVAGAARTTPERIRVSGGAELNVQLVIERN